MPTTNRRRAPALPADQRRAEIIEAATPLLLALGRSVTTRQIAAAADVAEGTIFGVFEDKSALIAAVVDAAFDPGPFEERIAAIDPELGFEERLIQAVSILQRRVEEIGELMTAVDMTQAPARASRPPTSIAALSTLFQADRDRLRRPPEHCARVLRAMTFAGTHPALIVDDVMEPAEIVDLVLHGVDRERPC